MEFKFRAGDDRPPLPNLTASSSSMSFFPEQALRANYSTDPNFIRSQIEMYTIQREIEKEKIRIEIIAAENVRRRLLEEEVRRELMMERETAARGSSETGLSTEESRTTQLDSKTRFPFTHKLDNNLLEERLAFPENRSLSFGPFGLNMLPPILPQLPDAGTDENKSTLEGNKKGKLIMLAKPDPNLRGIKRKAEIPPAAPRELPFINMKKKAKGEWSCALCEVTATSERGLNDHLQGRKHKSKEERLRAQAQKLRNNSTSPNLKESGKQTKVTVGGDTAKLEQKMEIEEASCHPNKAENGSDQKMGGVDLKTKDEKLPKNRNNKNEKVLKKKQNAKNQRKRKFKFLCEVCLIGAHSAVVMENHKKGRKHLARLKEQKLDVEVAPNITTTTDMTIHTSLKCTEKGKDVDVGAKEANEKTTENDTLVEGAEETENDALVKVTSEKGTENDSVVKEASEKTAEEDEDGSDQKIDGVDLTTKDEKLPKNQDNKIEKVLKKKQNAKNQRKRKFKFLCEVCQIGAHSAVVMANHKKGRKHLARLKEQKLDVEVAPNITTTTDTTIHVSLKCAEKGKDVDVGAKEANEKTTENDALVEGPNEETENDAVVKVTSEKGTENDAVVKEASEKTAEEDDVVAEEAAENGADEKGC